MEDGKKVAMKQVTVPISDWLFHRRLVIDTDVNEVSIPCRKGEERLLNAYKHPILRTVPYCTIPVVIVLEYSLPVDARKHHVLHAALRKHSLRSGHISHRLFFFRRSFFRSRPAASCAMMIRSAAMEIQAPAAIPGVL